MKLQGLLAGALVGSAILVTGCSKDVESANLEAALDVTTVTLQQYEKQPVDESQSKDERMQDFTNMLTANMNAVAPQVHKDPIGMELQTDGSFDGFHDANANQARDSGEKNLFKIEIDEEGNRLIASDDNGYARDRGFSGTGLLAGFLLGSLLSRQRAAGVSKGSFRNRQMTSRSSYSSARSRAGSGSHSSGK